MVIISGYCKVIRGEILHKIWYICFIYQYFRIQKSVLFKDSLSGIGDGSDAQEYGMPYMCQIDKASSNGLRHKVTDNIIFPACVLFLSQTSYSFLHNFQQRLYAFTLHGFFTCCYTFSAHQTAGTNCMIEVIQR
jgi:hypothetical protein